MLSLTTINIAGDAGVNYDLDPSELPPEWFNSGSNYLLRNGKITAYNGQIIFSSVPTSFSGSNVQVVESGGAVYYMVAGLGKVFVYDGTTWTELTLVGGYPSMTAGHELLWTNCSLGKIPILNNPVDWPQYWSPQQVAQKLLHLPYNATQTWKQKGFQCKVMRAHKNFLFAINMTESGIDYPNNYRWSHPADNNGLPFTWEELDLSAIAGTASILGDKGALIDGHSLRDAFCLYSTNGITVLDFEGGDFVWRARNLSTHNGLLATNCIADIYGRHIYLGNADILINDGNSITSVMHRKMRTRLEGLIDPVFYERSFATINPIDGEIWFNIPTQGSSFPNLAFIYNWKDDKVSIRDIAIPIMDMTYGVVAVAAETWASSTGPWSSDTNSWDFDAASPFGAQLVGVNATNSALYSLEQQDQSIELGTILERTNVVFGDQRQVTSIIRVYPHIRSSGTVRITFGSSQMNGGPVSWKPSVIYNPNTSRKVDIRTTGKLHAWRIESVGTEYFTYSGMDIEYVPNGVR